MSFQEIKKADQFNCVDNIYKLRQWPQVNGCNFEIKSWILYLIKQPKNQRKTIY